MQIYLLYIYPNIQLNQFRMKFIYVLILTGLLSLVSSCMDNDISKLSSELDLELSLAIPIIHSTTTLGDLLPDNENLFSDEDGYLSIAFRQDSIVEVRSDSLFVIDDQQPTFQSLSVGEIELPNFTSNISVVLNELTSNFSDPVLSDQIYQAITQSENFGYAYFPPIIPQTAGVYNTAGSEEFQSVLISEGFLDVEITNNFTIDLSTLELRISNASDNSQLGVFTFENIPAGSTESSSISIDNVLMYNEFNLEIVSISSSGTGGDPLDQTLWVPISTNDELIVTIDAIDLLATEGVVKYPYQEGPDNTLVVDLEFEDEAEIEFVDLSAGQFVYTFSSDVNTTLQITMVIPELLDENNNVFTELIEIVNAEEVTNSVSLENYKLDFSSSFNKLHINYTSEILANESFTPFNQNDQVSLAVGMENLDFNLIQGYFGQIEELIEEDAIEIDLSALSDIASGIVLESPSLIFTSDNSFGVPLELDIELTGVSETQEINLQGPIIEVSSESISSTTFNNSNSQLSEFISINPTNISFSGKVTTNPLGNTGIQNTLTPNSSISLGLEMDLPLHLRIQDAVTKDTLVLDFDSENFEDNDLIESVEFHLRTQNEFPMDVALTFFFEDSISGFILDSLNIGLLQAASVDQSGKTIEAIIYESALNLSSSQFDALINSNRTILDIRMDSYDNQNTAVKLYTDYEFIIDAGVLIETKTEE